MVLDLLRKAVCEPGKAAHVHPHGKIAALHIGRAHVGQIRVAFDTVLLGSDSISRAILALGAIRRGTVNLVQDGVVNIASKCAFNGLKIGLMAVTGKLDAIGKAAAQIIDKPHGAFAITPADEI